MSNKKSMLQVELLEPGNIMNIKLHGDPKEVCIMIAAAMDARQDIAAAFIAAVVEFCKKNGLPLSQLDYMVQIKM